MPMGLIEKGSRSKKFSPVLDLVNLSLVSPVLDLVNLNVLLIIKTVYFQIKGISKSIFTRKKIRHIKN